MTSLRRHGDRTKQTGRLPRDARFQEPHLRLPVPEGPVQTSQNLTDQLTDPLKEPSPELDYKPRPDPGPEPEPAGLEGAKVLIRSQQRAGPASDRNRTFRTELPAEETLF